MHIASCRRRVQSGNVRKTGKFRQPSPYLACPPDTDCHHTLSRTRLTGRNVHRPEAAPSTATLRYSLYSPDGKWCIKTSSVASDSPGSRGKSMLSLLSPVYVEHPATDNSQSCFLTHWGSSVPVPPIDRPVITIPAVLSPPSISGPTRPTLQARPERTPSSSRRLCGVR